MYMTRRFVQHPCMDSFRILRLAADDRDDARALFLLMASVFEEEAKPLSDEYLDQRLRDPKFWVLAAYLGRTILGGITAHTLPMTKGEYDEIFIYDLAVDPAYQRQGVGRRLVTALREAAAASGISEMFVPADNEDTHALDFYRALGGEPSAVTIFTYSSKP